MSKGKPWAVILIGQNGRTSTKHTSQQNAYDAVFEEQGRIAGGTSGTTGIEIRQYDTTWGKWDLYERFTGEDLGL